MTDATVRTLIFCVVAVLGLLLGALLIIPGYIDWNGGRAALQTRLGEHLDADVVIRGGLSVRLLPTPQLAATDVLVTRRGAGGGGEMWRMEVASVDARFSIGDAASLLAGGGVPAPEALALIRPRLTGGDALTREVFAKLSQGGGDAVAGRGREAPPAEIIIVDGDLRGPAPVGGPIALEKVNASVKFGDGGGVTWSTDLTVNGTAWTASGALGSPDPDARRSLSLSLVPRGGDAPVKLSGQLTPRDQNRFSGRATIEGDRLDRFGMAAGLAMPATLAMPFSASASLSVAEDSVVLDAIEASVGDARGVGRVAFRSRDAATGRAHWEARLNLTRLDLDQGDGLDFAQLRDGVVGLADPKTNWFLRAGDADIDLAVDAIQWHGGVSRQTKLAATAANGGLKITQATTQLPGGTDITLFGDLPAGEDTFAGRVEIGSDNLRATLGWLGVPLDAVAADRLRRVSALAALEVTRYAAGFSNIDARVDTSRLTGEATIALAAAGATARLQLDQIGLDGYLNQVGPGATLRALASHAWFDGVTLRVALAIDEVGFQTTRAHSVGVDLTVAGGALELDLGHVEIEGGLAELKLTARHPGETSPGASPDAPVIGISGTLTTPEGRRLARLVSSTVSLPTLGPISLAFSADGSVDRLTGALDARLTDGTARLAGTIVTGGAPAFDGTLELRSPDLGPLARRVLPATVADASPPRPTIASATMRLSADLNLARVDALQAEIGGSRIGGALSVTWPDRAPTDLAADITIDQLAASSLFGAMLAAVGPDDLTPPDTRFSGRLAIGVLDIGGFSFSDLVVTPKLVDGVVEAPITGRLFDGALDATVILSSSNLLPFQARLKLDKGKLASAGAAFLSNPAHDGRFTLQGELESRGESFQEIADGLHGMATVTARDIRVDGLSLTLLDSGPDTGGVGQLVGVLGGATSVGETELTLGFSRSRITLDRGRLTLNGGNVKVSGAIELPNEVLSLVLVGPNGRDPLTIGGTLDRPTLQDPAR